MTATALVNPVYQGRGGVATNFSVYFRKCACSQRSKFSAVNGQSPENHCSQLSKCWLTWVNTGDRL